MKIVYKTKFIAKKNRWLIKDDNFSIILRGSFFYQIRVRSITNKLNETEKDKRPHIRRYIDTKRFH